MSQKNDETLQIRDFRGINRFADGTVTPPDEFYTIQNYHSVSRGELRSIGGVTDLTATAMPGVQEIVHTQFLNSTTGDQRLICFFRPSMSLIPAPVVTTANFTTVGSSAVSYSIMITYVGPGGATNFTLTTFSIASGGFVFTLPSSGIPDYVAAIDIHAKLSATTTNPAFAWCGTVSRRAGVFPASITCKAPVFAVTASTAVDVQPTSFTAVPNAATGSLVGGRIYYAAIAPWVCQSSWNQSTGGRQTRAYNASGSTTGSNLLFFTFNLPTYFSAVQLSFNFAASPAVAAGTNVTDWVLFLGTTPEDMLAVCDQVNGNILPIPDTSIRSGVVVSEVPYNSRNTIHMTASPNMSQFDSNNAIEATADRSFGIFKNIMVGINDPSTFVNGGGDITESIAFVGNLPYLGAWVLPSLPFSLSTAYQLLPHINERNYVNANQYAPFADPAAPQQAPMVYWDPAVLATVSTTLESIQYANRIYCANNYNVMFYTNGYSMKTVVRDSGGQYIPICQYIGLVEDQLCLGGGTSSFANTDNNVFFSETANPNSFGTTAWNTFPVDSEDEGQINGFGLYSQNLSTIGQKTFLIVSKDTSSYSWNGQTGTNLIVAQIDQVGFAGPKAWAQTRFGTVFISRSGAYLVNGSTASSSLSQIGDEIYTILYNLSPALLKTINCTYHDRKMKIGYTQSSGLDAELWLELRQEDGGIQKFWSGPHALQVYTDQASNIKFNGVNDVRVSCNGAKLYQRDIGNSNVGSNINRSIVVSRLGMNQDHLRKLFDWVFLAVNINQDEVFTFTFTQEDGSAPFTVSSTALLTTAARQLLQTKIATRFWGRIESLTIANSSSMQNSIFDISMIYKFIKRRLLK